MPVGRAMAEITNGVYSDPQSISHETRIQRLETLAIENSKAIAQQSATLDSIGKQMVSSLDNVAEKIDSLTTNMGEKIGDLSVKVQKLDNKFHSSDDRIKDLEAKNKSWESLKRSVRKVIVPILAAGGASLVTYIVEQVLTKAH